MAIEPAADVQRLQVLHQQRAVQVAEVLEVLLVPGEGVGDVVLLGMVEEQVADGGDAERVGLGQLARSAGHQLVEGLLGGLLAVAALGQPDLLAVELDVPGVLGRAIPGLGGGTHCRNLLTLSRINRG